MVLTAIQYREMTRYLKKRYGEVIRGIPVDEMSDNQIFAMYNRIYAQDKIEEYERQKRHKKIFSTTQSKQLEQQITIEDLLKEAANV